MSSTRKGTNASGMRRYNERLILAAVRRMDGASKAELTRQTALSPQAVVRIVDELEGRGLLVQAGKRTGGMGQPATIYRINGEVGYTIGVEVGRSHITLVLLNFHGEPKASRTCPVSFPDIDTVLREINRFTEECLEAWPALTVDNLLGVGIAMPWFLGEWRDELGLSEDQAGEWYHAKVEERIRAGIAWPVSFENDGNAATLAQLLCGAGHGLQHFLCIHLGTFVGGGIVLDGRVFQGRHGNAGALASMPVLAAGKGDYLIHHASLYAMPKEAGPARDMWLANCADALTFAIIGANSLLDLEGVIIDGALGEVEIGLLLEGVRQRLSDRLPPDFFVPSLIQGGLGDSAPALGAGLLPLHASFSPDLAALAKSPASGES
ncbi:ROK family transcriptional regulator [Novosphingobium rosa]|uniref:ROK family transcriptional regulator n=1 Tax=Novosphingobium rosa TaxID=76978 RepID=UPI00083194B9|nr:ROK family transcriptional regulator [Novosphingobium rosa]